jgi:hypothetical protein
MPEGEGRRDPGWLTMLLLLLAKPSSFFLPSHDRHSAIVIMTIRFAARHV